MSLSAEQEPPPEFSLNHDRCIVHFDIDCFYAQVEEVLNPSLRGKPIGIRQKYLLVTCNYTARSLGVRKMESLVEAKRRCPSLVVMDGEDLTRYREASEAIFSYIAGVCGGMVQRLGLDEIFADVTELVRGGRFNSCSDGVETAACTVTGHLYAPGSGGTLLEAQTGLEISLDAEDNRSGDRRHRNNSESSSSSSSSNNHSKSNNAAPGRGTPLATSGEDPGRPTSSMNGTDPQQLRQAEPFVANGERGTSQDSNVSVESGICVRNLPTTTVVGSSSSSSSKKALGITVAGDSCLAKGGGERGCRCGCVERLSATSALADHVRRGLFEVVGYTCSAGIGCSKMTAKLAGELHKPNQQTTILPEHAMSMITQLPLRKLPGCGYSTCAKIKAELGITESRQLQAAPWPLLVEAVGVKLARVLFLLCRGEDPTPVVPSVRPKTMSDEDSFKRGTVHSRQQVEHHVRRLSTPLLRRAGERARLHKEAAEILRFGFRRASKGYGVRVSRQCTISSGVTAAWAAVEAAIPAITSGAAGTEAVGATEAVPAGTVAGTAAAVATEAVPAGSPTTTTAPTPPLSRHQQKQRDVNDPAVEQALSEVVRLVMALFDKMISPGEEDKLDLTLLSVGLSGFRGLEGGAQSGMARYLEASQPSLPADSRGGGGSSGRKRRIAGSDEDNDANDAAGTTRFSQRNPSSSFASSGFPSRRRLESIKSVDGLSAPSPRLHAESSRSVTVAAAASGDAAIKYSTVSTTSVTGAAPTAGNKRPRVSENPYQAYQQQRQQQQQQRTKRTSHRRSEQGGLRDRVVNAAAPAAEHIRRADADGGDPTKNGEGEWEGAEVLVVGEGGRTVSGRGNLEWCGCCRVHVLRADREEHATSGFHQACLIRSQVLPE